MRKIIVLLGIVISCIFAGRVEGQIKFQWNPRLLAGMNVNVVSPGGDDLRLFETSMGWGLSANYWFKPRTQIMVYGYYSKLNARADEYYDILDESETFDVWDVDGEMVHASAEIRHLYPSGPRNFMYLGLGADLFWFDTITGRYEIYWGGQPEEGTVAFEREPNLTGGIHFAPGMFFTFKSFLGQMFMDVGVRLHYIMDGDEDNPLWIDPYFSMGLQIF